MTYFNGTELRSMLLASGLLLLGAAARLGLGPGPDDFSWTESNRASGESRTLSTTLRQVADGVAAEEAAAEPLGRGERIDPNRASETQLRRLPGVGPKRARAIVDERESGGPFQGAFDLARVPGIGPRTLERLTPHLEFVARPTTPPFGPVSAPRPGSGVQVDVNRAQIKELEQITGIGPVLATRIAIVRQRYGPFRSYEDLLRVPGIGPAVLQQIRPQVRF